jgi:hypothetical protein
MSLDELKAVPDLVKEEIESKFGSLFLPKQLLSGMDKTEKMAYIKLFLNWGLIYKVLVINIAHLIFDFDRNFLTNENC